MPLLVVCNLALLHVAQWHWCLTWEALCGTTLLKGETEGPARMVHFSAVLSSVLTRKRTTHMSEDAGQKPSISLLSSLPYWLQLTYAHSSDTSYCRAIATAAFLFPSRSWWRGRAWKQVAGMVVEPMAAATVTIVEGLLSGAWDMTPFPSSLGLSAQKAFEICQRKECVIVREHFTGLIFLHGLSTLHLESYPVMTFTHLFIQCICIQCWVCAEHCARSQELSRNSCLWRTHSLQGPREKWIPNNTQ